MKRNLMSIALPIALIVASIFETVGCGNKSDDTPKERDDIQWTTKEIPDVCSYKIPDSWSTKEEKGPNDNGNYYFEYSFEEDKCRFSIENIALDNPSQGDALADSANNANKWIYDELKYKNETELTISKQARKAKSYSYDREGHNASLWQIGANYSNGYILLRLDVINDTNVAYDDIFKEIAESVNIHNPYVEAVEESNLDYIYFPDTMRWGMALAEVKDTETREMNTSLTFESKNPAYINYTLNSLTDEYSDSASIIYCFEDKILKARWCEFDPDKVWDYRGVYDDVKTALVSKYGDCESENEIWTDTTYQNDKNEWDRAFKYGYVTIKTVWHTENSVIIINWKYDEGMTVAFAALDYENQL